MRRSVMRGRGVRAAAALCGVAAVVGATAACGGHRAPAPTESSPAASGASVTTAPAAVGTGGSGAGSRAPTSAAPTPCSSYPKTMPARPAPTTATTSWRYPQTNSMRIDPPTGHPTVSAATAWAVRENQRHGDRGQLVLAALTVQFPGQPAALDHRLVWLDLVFDVPVASSPSARACQGAESLVVVDATSGRVLTAQLLEPPGSDPPGH